MRLHLLNHVWYYWNRHTATVTVVSKNYRMADSVLTTLLAELQANQNHNASIERSKIILKELEVLLDKRVIAYFSSETGVDANTMVNDEDVFLIENLLSVDSNKKDLVLILHSDGGYALSAERIIDVCRNYCAQRGAGNNFFVVVPKKAKSAATIVALGADKTYLKNTAELGPVDPQFVIRDKNGNMQVDPAYMYVDALENIVDEHRSFKRFLKKKIGKPLANLPSAMRLKILEQCNYPMYVNAKNELGLSDSIIEKIAKEKTKLCPNVRSEDFDIFRDPHITKSHGRLINISDLSENNLQKEKIINSLESLFDQRDTYINFDNLLWELYVRKRQLLNDHGNSIVKTIESTEEFFLASGAKRGQQTQTPTP